MLFLGRFPMDFPAGQTIPLSPGASGCTRRDLVCVSGLGGDFSVTFTACFGPGHESHMRGSRRLRGLAVPWQGDPSGAGRSHFLFPNTRVLCNSRIFFP